MNCSDLELAYKLHLAAEQAAVAAAEDGASGGEVEQSPPVDWSNLYPGALAAVKLDQVVDYGAIMDIVGQEDLVGLVHPHQGASQPELLGGELTPPSPAPKMGDREYADRRGAACCSHAGYVRLVFVQCRPAPTMLINPAAVSGAVCRCWRAAQGMCCGHRQSQGCGGPLS